MSLSWKPLEKWFRTVKRDLPWRRDTSPYAVWVSEVMLQQTQVAVVIPYFKRWMSQFPTVEALAKASQDDVVKCWEGLGYYSRARNLHAGAQYICAYHQGVFPRSEEELAQIKGIGPYTMAAIRCFAFGEKAAPVDGNVLRVMSRLWDSHDDVAKAKTRKNIRERLLDLLPDRDPHVVAEGLIELGALICKRNPLCRECPLKANCQAHARGTATQLPIKSGKQKGEVLHRAVAVITSGEHLLVKKVQEGQVMAGLHEFPFWTLQEEVVLPEEVRRHIQRDLGLHTEFEEPLAEETHGFTHFKVFLKPFLFQLENRKEVEGYRWVDGEELEKIAFSSGHRKVLKNYQEI